MRIELPHRYTPQPAGYIYVDTNCDVIYGVGATADEAWSRVVEGVGTFIGPDGQDIPAEQAREEQFREIPATAALLAKVDAEGGNIPFSIDGPRFNPYLAMTREENDSTYQTLVLCRSDAGDGGWSLHAPDSTDEDIANGDAPALASGDAWWMGDGWSRPNVEDMRAAWARLFA